MNEAQILEKVKNLLGMGTSNYQDELLLNYVDIVKTDMRNAGVSEEVLNSKMAIGNIVRGVIDNWNYGTDADYSPMFDKRNVQLRAISIKQEAEDNE